MSLRTCALIPALNEERHLADVLARTRPHVDGLLVIDDGSTDRTRAIAQAANPTHVILHERPHGKGASLAEGLDWIASQGFDATVCLDGDAQHDPDEIPRFLERADDFDLLIGNRMDERRDMPWVRWQTNRFTSWTLGRLSGVRVPDTQCGFRWIRAACWRDLHVASRNFDFEGEMIVAAGRGGWRVGNVPVRTIYGDEVSQIHPVRDTVRFFRMVFRLWRNRSPRRDAGRSSR